MKIELTDTAREKLLEFFAREKIKSPLRVMLAYG